MIIHHYVAVDVVRSTEHGTRGTEHYRAGGVLVR